MAYSYNDFENVAGTQVVFPISFEGDTPGYIEEDHVFVTYDGVVQDQADRSFDTPTQVRLDLGNPGAGVAIRILRTSSITQAIVDFEGGSHLSERNLDKNTLQMLYLVQESTDTGENVTTDVDLAVTLAQEAQAASELARDESEDARDVSETNKDLTAADVVSTNADVVLTNADVVDSGTNAGVAATQAAAAVVSAGESEDSADDSEASYQAALLVEADVVAQGDTQVARVITEGDTQDARVEAQGDTQDTRVETEGDTQVARLESLGDEIITVYDPTVNYIAGISYTIGSNGIIYFALITNGPASTVVNPVGDVTGTWEFAHKGFGIGQLWINKTASRAASVEYTNTTGASIFISITTGSGNYLHQLDVDGIIIGRVDSETGVTANLFAIVEDGSTYEFTTTGVLNQWFELTL